MASAKTDASCCGSGGDTSEASHFGRAIGTGDGGLADGAGSGDSARTDSGRAAVATDHHLAVAMDTLAKPLGNFRQLHQNTSSHSQSSRQLNHFTNLRSLLISCLLVCTNANHGSAERGSDSVTWTTGWRGEEWRLPEVGRREDKEDEEEGIHYIVQSVSGQEKGIEENFKNKQGGRGRQLRKIEEEGRKAAEDEASEEEIQMVQVCMIGATATPPSPTAPDAGGLAAASVPVPVDSFKLDPKWLDKPTVYDGRAVDWKEWKRKMKTWLCALDPRFGSWLDEACTHTSTITQ